jgi:hypothetical protein
MTWFNRKLMLATTALALAVLGLYGLLTPAPGLALKSYATATGQSCGACHVDPAGGGSLTAKGSAFAAISTHSSDPKGAWTKVSAPVVAPTNTPVPTKPAPTPTLPAPTAIPVVATATTAPAVATPTPASAVATVVPPVDTPTAIAVPSATPIVEVQATSTSIPVQQQPAETPVAIPATATPEPEATPMILALIAQDPTPVFLKPSATPVVLAQAALPRARAEELARTGDPIPFGALIVVGLSMVLIGLGLRRWSWQ